MIGLLEQGIKHTVLSRTHPIVLQIHKRFKKKKAPKILNTHRALEYFDTAYPPVYGTRWPSIRLGLLSKPKYISVVNNFGNYETAVEKIQELGAVDIRPRLEASVEKLKASRERMVSQLPLDSQKKEVKVSGVPETIRPSLYEPEDDEIVARINAEERRRYPEEYRKIALAKNEYIGEIDIDLQNRVILPSQVGPDGSLLMDHVPSNKLKGLENWIEETDVFFEASQGDQDIGLVIEKQEELIDIPANLKVYSFLKGDISDFPQPKNDSILGVLDQYLLDGGSLLPVLALDIKPGDRMLDLCAAPGGKSLIALQTLVLKELVCNDISISRVNRMRNIFKQYIPSGLSSVFNMISVTERNGCKLEEYEAYDKVLVDVPCLTDRHSLKEDDNNIFIPRRVKERLRLPEIQAGLLVAALTAVRPGGTVVYSTCTLSPLQNDGVVHLALTKIWQDTKIDCSVVDMSYAVQPLSFLYKFGTKLGLRYGQIVLPTVINNYGPMYVAKIKRVR